MKQAVLLLSFFYALLATGQPAERCGTNHLQQQTLQNNPAQQQNLTQALQAIDAYLNTNGERNSRGQIITIPVVFHVIHGGEAIGTGLNIADSQVVSQIAVLNECFRKRNTDTILIPNWFKNRVADTEVEFCLARTDPQGNPTNGITRHLYANTNNFDANIKPATQWPPNHYLNIWTTTLPNIILGYSTMPGIGPANQDGVVIDYRRIGKAPANPYGTTANAGRTAVHEVGHWLGLYHTFHDSCRGTTPATCATEGDRICDTPPEAEPTYGSSPNLVQNSCSETPVDEYDMWMNYMDYVDDNWLLMFTNGQRDVMQAVLNTLRVSIQTSPGCNNAATAFAFSGHLTDSLTGNPLAQAHVLYRGPKDFEATTDTAGNFTIDSLTEGYYYVYAGKWGHYQKQHAAYVYYSPSHAADTIALLNGCYCDDFLFDFNWATDTTASTGAWQRAAPLGTTHLGQTANPAQDVATDYGLACYATGNSSAIADLDDVDNGTAYLTSPLFNLSTYTAPYLRYRRWFYAGELNSNAPDDTLKVYLSNGTDTVLLEKVSTTANQWNEALFKITDYLPLTAAMQLLVHAADLPTGTPNIVEAGLDAFMVFDSMAVSNGPNLPQPLSFTAYPNPTTAQLHITYPPHSQALQWQVTDMLGQVVARHFTQANTPTPLTFNLSHCAPGVYFVACRNAYSEKIVKILLAR